MNIPLAAMAQTDGVAGQGGGDRQRAIACLANAIAYEAGHEPLAGQQAVAEVVLNRLRAPAYPKSVCGVVFAGSQRRTGCQFSFTCDGSMKRRLSATVLNGSRQVAESALDGRNPVRVVGATHYHADYVYPYWAPSLSRVGSIGRHIFYRPPGARDQAVAAVPVMAFAEPRIAKLNDANPSSDAVSDAARGGAPAQRPADATAPTRPAAFAPWGLTVTSPGSRQAPVE